ncbi:unnamed protein product [Medioppia subpectinata]|uniref:D-isomer specific 2-hydroxyacid dehydrogenase NAD-binding domain-containing protein n=1 Tax=Medioppia subpectinata TaxID=1979941 RepID=A0A7R9Q0Z0_9ACAR|nr:unnamed protein product [Medioppia subpectinata]CAG2107787.1 unnamed protein product [Medioppia subpectinata]
MSKVVYVLSQIPQLSQLLAKSLPDCRVVNIPLTKYSGKFSLDLKIGDKEIDGLKEAEILLGDPNLLAQTLHKLPAIKWMQNTWAGIDWFVNAMVTSGQKPPNCLMTRFSGEGFGQSMFEYCIAHMIMTERKFFDDFQNTKIHKTWQKELLWDFKSIDEMTIAILGGKGAIGSYMAHKFRQLGSRVVSYGRTKRYEHSITDIPLDKYNDIKYSTKLEDILPECDYLISVLPSTPHTKGLLDNNVLELCSRKIFSFTNL